MTEEQSTDRALAAEREADDAALAQKQQELDAARADDATDDATITALQAEVERLKKLQPAPEPVRREMLVGGSFDDGSGGGNRPEPFEKQMGLVAPQTLDLFRYYDSGDPAATWPNTQVGRKGHVGKRPLWWSSKGDITAWGNPNSTLIANAKNLAKTYNPDWPDLYWTIWHEVQPKLVDKVFTFAQFKRGWSTFYEQVKPLCPPNVKLMVIHGGYAWRPATKSRPSGAETTIPSSQDPYCASPAEWRTLPVDLKGVDAYGGPQVEDIIEMGRFQRFVNEMAQGDLSQVAIAESSCRQSSLLTQAGGDVAKANQAGQDWMVRCGKEFATGTNSDGVKIWDGKTMNAWCLWNSGKTENPGNLTPEQSHAFGDVWRRWSPNRP